jgi:hypothetical protein
MEKALSPRTWLQTELSYFARNFFRPWRIFTDVSFTDGSLDVKEKRAEALNEDAGALATVVQKAICYNQGALIEFAYMSGEKHKAMKEAHRDGDLDALPQNVQALIDYLNGALRESVLRNFQSLSEYYALREHGPKPRICLKGNSQIREKEGIVRLFGDAEVDYKSNTEIENNSGHNHIYQTGMYFMENNIPEAAARGDYKNPRLNIERTKLFVAGQLNDWKECWVDRSTDTRAYYKSTLIVPLTLRNNQLSSEFKDMAKNFRDVDRAIFGYLCLDSTERDYFTEQDVKVGYIYADLLSVFMFIRKMYTEISDTYKEASMRLLTEKIEVTLKRMPKALRSISVSEVYDKLNKDPIAEETSNNSLLKDKPLLEYVK